MLGSGAVRLVQRFGSALNLNLHFHMLYLNGVYDNKGYFWPVRPPTPEDLDRITYAIAKRIARYLERARYLYRDASLSTWIWYADAQHLANRLVQFIYHCGMAMSDWVGMVCWALCILGYRFRRRLVRLVWCLKSRAHKIEPLLLPCFKQRPYFIDQQMSGITLITNGFAIALPVITTTVNLSAIPLTF